MSTEVAAPDVAPAATLDKNAQAAEDAKNMLAELQGGATAGTDAADAPKEEIVDLQENHATTQDKSIGEYSKHQSKQGGYERHNYKRDRDDGRFSRGGGRGSGGYQTQNYRDNIKSDLTSQKESSDPVAIRKQVQHDCVGV